MADVSSDNLRRKLKDILKDADLSSLSAKKVRLELQATFDTDLSSRKKEIDQMTMKLIVEMEEKNEEEDKGVSEEEEEENVQNQSHSENEEAAEPPKKKTKTPVKKKQKKKRANDEDDELAPLENDDLNAYDEEQRTLKLSDEELAKRLQSFEDTGRRTRNNNKPRKEKRKSSGGNRMNSLYVRPCVLSPALAAVMEVDQLPRNEIVTKMWQIVKERKLQDPKDKRFIICDEQLHKVFGRKRVKTFGMMKYLQPHIRDEASSLESVITNSDIYDDEADDD